MGRKMGNQYELKVVNVRLVKEPSLYSSEKITTPEDAIKVIADEFSTFSREVFGLLLLKTNGKVIGLNICSVGTLDASLVSPRELFQAICLSNAGSFIAVHNHPSSSLEPSAEDRDVTKRLLMCSEMMNVRMLDHIIVAGETGEYYSFRQDGEMERLRPRDKAWER